MEALCILINVYLAMGIAVYTIIFAISLLDKTKAFISMYKDIQKKVHHNFIAVPIYIIFLVLCSAVTIAIYPLLLNVYYKWIHSDDKFERGF